MATQVSKPNSEIKLIENQSNLQFPVNYTGDKGLSLLLANFITSFGAVEYLTTAQFLNGQFPNAPEGYTQTPCVLPGAIQQNILSGNDTISAIKYVDMYIIGDNDDKLKSDFDLGLYKGDYLVNGEVISNLNNIRYINVVFLKNTINIGVKNFLDIADTAYSDAMFKATVLGIITLRIVPWGNIEVAATNLGIDLLNGWNNIKTTKKDTLPNVINELYDLAFAGGAGPAGGALTGNYPNPQLGIEVVNTANLANGAVATERIANGAVTGQKIANETISGDNLIPGTVGEYRIANGAITNNKIQDGAITADKIYKVSVTETKIASDAVSNRCLALDSVDTINIINGAVTTEKIADRTITGGKIAIGGIGSNEIANNSIYGMKLANDTISISKLDNDIAGRLSYGFFGGKFDVPTGTIIDQFSTMATTPVYQVGTSPNVSNTLVFTFNNPTAVMMMSAVIATPIFNEIAEDHVTLSAFVYQTNNTVQVKVIFKSEVGTSMPFNGGLYVVFYLGNSVSIT